MTGRASVFADPNTIKLINDNFVAVALDDWYQRRREDAEGKFWKKVYEQTEKRDSQTKQGVYSFTADGTVLTYRNHLDAEVMQEEFRNALEKFAEIPAAKRKPGAIRIEDNGKPDERYHRVPPKGGLVLRTYTRILDKKGDGYCKGKCDGIGRDFSSRDHVWIQADEWKKLLPEKAKKGDAFEMPEVIGVRLARFHLTDNTRGEPPAWEKKQIRNMKMTLTVEESSEDFLKLRLDGDVLLTTDPDEKKADRGFDVRLLGYITYEKGSERIIRFDALAVGDHWGNGPYTAGARPGRKPLGIALELARGNQDADKVPPQGARWLDGYYRSER